MAYVIYIYISIYIYICIKCIYGLVFRVPAPQMVWVPRGPRVAPLSLLFASYWQHFWGPASYLLIPTIHTIPTIRAIHTIPTTHTKHTIHSKHAIPDRPYTPYISNIPYHTPTTPQGGKGDSTTPPPHQRGRGTVPPTTPRGGKGDTTMADLWPWPGGGGIATLDLYIYISPNSWHM